MKMMMISFLRSIVAVLVLFNATPGSLAWVSMTTTTPSILKTTAGTGKNGIPIRTPDRRGFLQSLAVAAAAASPGLWSGSPVVGAETLPGTGVTYEVLKQGTGPQPEVGELVAIRFAAYSGDNTKIDDIFGTPEPYYTRVGSGALLPGVEQALPYMKLGDRWKLTIPPELAFGSKGRPASAGKPRIPGNAVIIFDVEMVGLPGKEPELIELIGDV